MGETTHIAWCDHTFNGWIGCHKVSDACKHCYAEVSTPVRTLRAKGLPVWGASAGRYETSDDYWRQPLRWNRAAARDGRRARVFCSSLADVFESHSALPRLRARLWDLVAATPHLDWLLLTKRPENILSMIPPAWAERAPSNVWYGTTAEHQAAFAARVRHLHAVPAVVRFLSMEPLLGPVNIGEFLHPDTHGYVCYDAPLSHDDHPERKWVIVGGESGPDARPLVTAWVRSIVAQCRAAGVAVFVKQLGARPMSNPGQAETLLRLRDRKGGDPAEWPADLRVREWPAADPGRGAGGTQ